MRILTRSIAVLLLSASLLAQTPNMAGQWQGVLPAGKELRIVVVITNTDGLKATMYSIDQARHTGYHDHDAGHDAQDVV
jgi:hypothetical protein